MSNTTDDVSPYLEQISTDILLGIPKDLSTVPKTQAVSDMWDSIALSFAAAKARGLQIDIVWDPKDITVVTVPGRSPT
ncbi:hypothetical protein UFOVP1519_62 [uncultured Caudovirales phage]|uniref:Uncharacterized protein n=1 Tax=uncultured Caudovirales phage TaxID=2100421 RepID=A0A6J7XA21_9CAUD|nr:hypothetical protein UFOVP1306_2 [uncultured Caudovirales phage]CAB4210230.1 hypothetical protein UFOVP1422_4 [uncultured Caudovirales phage]CAB5227577.1 hypothetical protein UFOVP1519_62 [uncultured Caudovirales phage]